MGGHSKSKRTFSHSSKILFVLLLTSISWQSLSPVLRLLSWDTTNANASLTVTGAIDNGASFEFRPSVDEPRLFEAQWSEKMREMVQEGVHNLQVTVKSSSGEELGKENCLTVALRFSKNNSARNFVGWQQTLSRPQHW